MEIDLSGLQSILADPYAQMAGLALLSILILIVFIFITRSKIKKYAEMFGTFEKVILLVTVPKSTGGKEKAEDMAQQSIQEDVAVAELFLNSIGSLKAERGFKQWLFGRKDNFSLEIVARNGLIYFYAAVPRDKRNFIEQQINAQYPSASIEEVNDYNIFQPAGAAVGSYLVLKRENLFPIKTYKKLESDPMNALTNALSKIGEEEGAAIQLIVRSARAEWRRKGVHVASEMQQGKKLSEVLGKNILGSVIKDVSEAVKTSKPEDIKKEKEPYKLSPLEEEMVKGIEEKSGKMGLDVNIRVIASSSNKEKAKMHLEGILNSFGQYNWPQYGNSFSRATGGSIKRMIHDFVFRRFNEKMKIVLNTEELASIYHFPHPSTETPNIHWLMAKKAAPPVNMPKEGTVLGKSIYRGKEITVRIKREDRRRHMYIIGMTGTGKSWFMDSVAMQDILNGEGMCFIDPHGDDVNKILSRIPKNRVDDVIVFDPSDFERPMALNMLEYEKPEQKIFVINEILAIFDKLYDLKATGGPMFEQYMRNALMLIMDDPESGSTLLEVPRVLADEEFRKRKLEKCKTQVVRDFWIKEAQKAGGEASLQNMVPYITSKLTPFIANDLMRPIISQQKSSFNFRKVMDERKILLISLAKGKIGDVNSNLLGMIVIGKLLMAALGRVDMPESERHDFYLYVDEFQNFLTDSIKVILSEARKYRLCLNIAHQYIGQLVKGGDTGFKDAIFGNVGTKIGFRIGVDDAETLAKEFTPVFSEQDFLNVPKYNAYIKLLIDNANPPAFNMATVNMDDFSTPNLKIAEAIKQLSRLKYGRDRMIVEHEVMERVNAVDKIAKEAE